MIIIFMIIASHYAYIHFLLLYFLIALGINSSGICGALFVADPVDACRPLSNDIRPNKTEKGIKFVLIVRGECAFEEKVQNAQNAGFRAAIVYDNQDKGNLVYSESLCSS